MRLLALINRAALGRALGRQGRVFVRNSSWMFSATVVRSLLAFAKSVVVARGLGVESFGRFALLVAFVGVVQEMLNLNLGTTVIKYGADYRAQGRLDKLGALVKASVTAYLMLGGLSVCVVAGVMVGTSGGLLGMPELKGLVIVYAAVSSTSYFDALSLSLLRLFDKFRLNALIQAVASLLDFVLVTCVVLVFPKQLAPFVVAAVIGKLLDACIVNGAAAVELKPHLLPYMKARVAVLRPDLRVITEFVLSTSVSRTLYAVLDRGDVLLLGTLTSTQHVGLYAIAKKLAQAILRFTDPLAISIFPQSAALVAAGRRRELSALLGGLTKVTAGPVLVLLTVGFFAREPLVVALYGSGYAPAGDPFYIHLIATAFMAMFFWHIPLVQSTGRVRARLISTLLALPLAGGLALVFIPRWGVTGMAAAMTTARVTALAAMLAVCYRALTGRESIAVLEVVPSTAVASTRTL